MSQAKHTPGPWTLSETARYSYVRGAAAIEGEKYITQRCVDGMSRARSERTRADCRLIAAAPDLLEALRRLLPKPFVGNPSNEELIAFWKRERDLGRAQADDFLAAYAAIAKATGSAA